MTFCGTIEKGAIKGHFSSQLRQHSLYHFDMLEQILAEMWIIDDTTPSIYNI